MIYAVEILDDEVLPKKWRRVIFGLTHKVEPEVYRALMGASGIQPKIRRTTTDHSEALLKLAEMKNEGWKTRIIQTESEDEQ